MAHDFEIRFNRLAGFAGILEAPANRFRWKGAGRLSIDAQGVIIAARRGITSLLREPTTRRIDAADLAEVYREGAELRLEFANEAGRREILPMWARDSAAAADIVRHLPTRRTVELEHAVSRGAPAFQWDRRLLAILLLTPVVIALIAWLTWMPAGIVPERPASTPSPLPTTPAIVESPIPEATSSDANEDLPVISPIEPQWQNLPVEVAPPAIPVPVEAHVEPIPRGTIAHAVARRALERFDAVAATLRFDYRAQQASFQANALTNEQFADYLRSSLEMRWWNTTFELLANDALVADELLDLRAALLACARHWRGFLDGYAEGLLKRDHVIIAAAFDRMAMAEEMQARARRFAPR